MRFGERHRLATSILAAALTAATAVLLPGAPSAQDGGQASAGVTFFTGPNFTGSSKMLTLAPGQPYAAIPYIGDELNEQIASLRADPQIGVILFQRPYFASRDDACGPNLGTREDLDAWWLGLTADFEPPIAGDQPYETAETADDDYSSVIAYRREMGPPPGFLLLERRSYYNRDCERSDEQSYFNRLFVPVPNPPQREACMDLAVPAGAHGAGSDAPRFARISEAYALFPEAFSRSYGAVDHRFALTLFDGPGCSGDSVTLASRENGRPASYRLSAFDFDRRVRSVSIRYQRGPLDAYMAAAPAADETALVPAPMPAPASPAPVAPTPAAPATTAPVPTAPAPAAPAPTATAPAAAAPASPAPMTAPGASVGAVPAAPAPAPAPAPQQPLASPPPAGGGLQPAPPSAPPQPQQQALQPVPQPQLAPAPAPAPTRPAGPTEETFRFPVHQVYRLNYCLQDEQGCGEPAATAWCKERGFNRALRWTQEDNIGALYPTVFIGSGNLCDKFLCDGFEEITCSQ